MSNDVIPHDDDGFNGSLAGGRLIKGFLIKWNETQGWFDRDGLRPPEIMIVHSIDEALQRWQSQKVIDEIRDKPLPDVDALNETIPVAEWEPGLDGRPKPPYSHQRIIYLLDYNSGQFYTYMNSTIGARIMWDNLRERVTVVRMLRGSAVRPIVKLTHRPMKTSFGMKHRPELEIIDWFGPRDGGGDVLGGPPTPQISSPTTPVENPPAAAAAQALAGLKRVEPPSRGEEMDDQLPW